MVAKGYEVSVWGDENVPKLMVMMIHNSELKTIEIYTFGELYGTGTLSQSNWFLTCRFGKKEERQGKTEGGWCSQQKDTSQDQLGE